MAFDAAAADDDYAGALVLLMVLVGLMLLGGVDEAGGVRVHCRSRECVGDDANLCMAWSNGVSG